MGLGGIGPVQLIIVLAIILLIFGTKKLRNFGSDLGGAIKGFKKAMSEDEEKKNQEQIVQDENAKGETFEAKAEKVEEKN